MKLSSLLVAVTLMAVASGAGAQTKTPPEKPLPKKGMPVRDLKTGKFTKKATPARDPKTGRFLTKHTKAKPAAKRDPKTGRFVRTKG